MEQITTTHNAHHGIESSQQENRPNVQQVGDGRKVTAEMTVRAVGTGDTNEESSVTTPLTEKSPAPDNGEKRKQTVQTVDNGNPIIRRPVKRARTAYIIFSQEKRSEVQKENPGETVASLSKIMGQLWGNLSEKEKQVYIDKAAAERERVANEVEAWRAAGGTDPTSQAPDIAKDDLILPVSKIRKICKLDPEVKNMSKEALMLMCKTAELALAQLGQETVKVAHIQNRRKLLPDDVAQVCATREPFLFLREDLQDLARTMAPAKKSEEKRKMDAAAAGTRKLTDMFGIKSDKSKE